MYTDCSSAAYLMALGHNAAFWIGLNDKTVEGGFAWTDGVPLSYINWNDGQPDNWYEVEHCIELTMWQRGSWNDGFCNASRPALCEKRGELLLSSSIFACVIKSTYTFFKLCVSYLLHLRYQ
jgi:hypothetical protein